MCLGVNGFDRSNTMILLPPGQVSGPPTMNARPLAQSHQLLCVEVSLLVTSLMNIGFSGVVTSQSWSPWRPYERSKYARLGSPDGSVFPSHTRTCSAPLVAGAGGPGIWASSVMASG